MTRLLATIGILALGFAAAAQAQAPAGAPAGTTGLCKDGSYYSGATKQGACRGHQGVKDWYGAATAPAAKAAAAKSTTAPAAAPAAAPPVAAVAKPASVAPAGAPPAGATGLCKDGTYYTGATKQGACRGHQGVKDWYADAAAPAAAKPAAAPAPVAAAAPAQAPAVVSAPAAAPTAARATAPTVAAPGGGNGQVWVNKSTKVYHCPGDRWYGKTKDGAYLSEADARAQGYKADHNKSCT